MLPTLLAWVLPLVWGALIGYLTNALAIRMLFRPLARKYLLGIPLPLTPGIIPRRRGELARSIARMVSRELLSPDAVRDRLDSETFRHALQGQFRSLRETILRKPLAELAAAAGGGTGAPEHRADADAEIVWSDLLRRLLGQVLRRLVGSRAFIHGVRAVVRRLVADLGARRLTDLVAEEQLARLVAGRVLPALTGAAVRSAVSAAIKRWLRSQRRDDTPLENTELRRHLARRFSLHGRRRDNTLGRFLTADTVELLVTLLRRNLPALAGATFAWLRRPEMRHQLEVRGRALLRDILDKLNPLQKVFVTAGQYDHSLNERMPEIVTDVIEQAEAAVATAAVQGQIVAAARRTLTGWGERGVGDIIGHDQAQLDELVEHLVRRVFDALAGSDRPGADGSAIERAIGRWYRETQTATVAELAARYLGVQPQAVADGLANLLLSFLSRPETVEQLAEQIPDLVTGALGAAGAAETGTVADVVSLSPETEQRLDRFVAARTTAFLAARVPELLRTIDVEALVIAKIDALDARSVEQLLLTVMARHLKWVKLFGAVIGAAIGLLMIVLQTVAP